MLRDHVQECLTCGNKPKLQKIDVDNRVSTHVKYLRYECGCGISTFGTREEIFCRELWNAGVDLARKKLTSK